MNRLIFALSLAAGLGCSAPAPGARSSPSAVAPSASAPTAPSTADEPLCKLEACWKRGVDPSLSEDEKRASLRVGCDQGHALSCDYLSQYYAVVPCPKSPGCLNEEGVAIARRACELGAGAPCFHIVETLGEKLSAQEREQLHTRACFESYSVMSWAPACTEAARLAAERGSSERAAAVRKHFAIRQDCNEEVAEACTALDRQPKWTQLPP